MKKLLCALLVFSCISNASFISAPEVDPNGIHRDGTAGPLADIGWNNFAITGASQIQLSSHVRVTSLASKPGAPAAGNYNVYIRSGNLYKQDSSDVESAIGSPTLTASRAVATDVAGSLVASSVSDVELGYVSGVTSAIQTQLGNKAASGANSDITSLSGLTTALSVTQGGTGQITQTAAFDALDPLTSKGDLIVHDGTNSARQAVGANGFVLTADSAEASGVKWAATAAGGDTFAGADKQVQFKDGTSPGIDADLQWDKTNNSLAIGSTATNANLIVNSGAGTNDVVKFKVNGDDVWRILSDPAGVKGMLRNGYITGAPNQPARLILATPTDLTFLNEPTINGILQDIHISRGWHSDAKATGVHFVAHIGDRTAAGAANGMTAQATMMDADVTFEGSVPTQGIKYKASENAGYGYTSTSGHLGGYFQVNPHSSVAGRQHEALRGALTANNITDRGVGVRGYANGATNSWGILGQGAFGDRDNSNYVGVVGTAQNGAAGSGRSMIGGLFSFETVPTIAADTRTALLVNNFTYEEDIARFQDNGNNVWKIKNGGTLSSEIAGVGISIKEDLNARMGVATLAAGTATVSNTSVTENTRVFLTCQVPNAGTPGSLYVSARTESTDFTITSTSGADTCIVAWILFEPS